LAKVGSGQPKYLINTHRHWDHTDEHVFTPVPVSAWPTVIVHTVRKMSFGGEDLLLQSYAPAHTDGDISVYLKNADVLVTGDTYWNGVYPFIDYVAGGSIDGMIRAANDNITRITDKTLIVPGHGPVSGREDLVAYRDMLVGVRENVAKLKKQGKTLNETLAAHPSAEYDGKWGQFVIDPAFFTRLVYKGV
jgi:glyoxylase-like metal-dependent hydrolase (beta-lactamase superfamily II)